MQPFRFCSILPAFQVASGAFAADADNGKRVAEMRCVACHIVSPNQRRDVTAAPPFEVIARKFSSNPETLAFSILDPHPRMNVTLTHREAQDVAAYISTFAKKCTVPDVWVADYWSDAMTLTPVPPIDRHAEQPHWFGLGHFGNEVKLITVLQLRHENVSNCALCSSDLLLSIANPQSGQCRTDGRG